MKHFFILSLLVAVAAPFPAKAYRDYAVAAAHPLAVEAGANIIEQGGNAIDAAIAVQMVLNVVEPESSGIGGGGFMLWYDAETKEMAAYDGRETAPMKISPKQFLNKEGDPVPFKEAVRGGRSVGTPGLLEMLKLAHSQHGMFPWNKLFDDAIRVASEGFHLSPRLYYRAKKTDSIHHFKASKEQFLTHRIGDITKNPALAATFNKIASEGIKPFYYGEIADNIVKAVQKTDINPGTLSKKDLSAYQAKIRDVVCMKYRVYKVCGMPPPSSGGYTVLQILGLLEHTDLGKLAPLSADAIHIITQAMRMAYADRNAFLADPDFVDMPLDIMLDKDYLKKRAELIDNYKAFREVGPGIRAAVTGTEQEKPSTTHISIVDKEGNAVSLTSSIEHAFGSGILVDGFLLNNELTDFSFIPERNGKLVANRIEPGKRPRSSMAPTFVFDKDDNLILVVGSPGGPRIISYVAQTILAVLDWDMEIQEAVNLPHYLNLGQVTELEEGRSIIGAYATLSSMGHRVQTKPLRSGIHAIRIKDGVMTGAADSRRDGTVMGK